MQESEQKCILLDTLMGKHMNGWYKPSTNIIGKVCSISTFSFRAILLLYNLVVIQFSARYCFYNLTSFVEGGNTSSEFLSLVLVTGH
ncbi:E3 ubiquitin-protein ligase UPL3 [Iris pallida]|uniref:E3 ubiquitin-protein ligase UPL3 n=1 Tax=Iris pallida TaxID=29817 RepID=A0AAX6F7H6_IRIPA|nr:E3 ubiquitin-protein ligase UPL3 [Iris pallida]